MSNSLLGGNTAIQGVADSAVGGGFYGQNLNTFDVYNSLFIENSATQNGSGLGLSISQRLVSINKGIVIFDEDKNKTIFKIILPIDKY